MNRTRIRSRSGTRVGGFGADSDPSSINKLTEIYDLIRKPPAARSRFRGWWRRLAPALIRRIGRSVYMIMIHRAPISSRQRPRMPHCRRAQEPQLAGCNFFYRIQRTQKRNWKVSPPVHGKCVEEIRRHPLQYKGNAHTCICPEISKKKNRKRYDHLQD